jgi:hypothetical protein
MTLVVAKIINEKIYIESDSKITDEYDSWYNPLLGVLKIVIISPSIAISYSGNISYAEEALKYIITNNVLSYHQIIHYLYSVHTKSCLQTNFLICILKKNETSIVKIFDNQVYSGDESYWIGDAQAFNTFQFHFLPLIKEGKSKLDSLKNAFTKVIEDELITTVGNFNFSVYTDDEVSPQGKVFLYKDTFDIQMTEMQGPFDNKINLPISLGSVKGGSYGISYLSSFSPEMHGIALHFTHFDLGVLFCPQISFDGIIFREITGMAFVNLIKEKYKLPLRGFIRVSDSNLMRVNTSIH